VNRGKKTALYAAEWVFALAATAKGFHDGFASLAVPPLSSRADSLFRSAMISLGSALVVAFVICIQKDAARRRGSAP
jgi:hypothetical protein